MTHRYGSAAGVILFLLSVLPLLPGHALRAQEPAVVWGTVIDDVSERPVAGVAVSFEDEEGERLKQVVTGEGGHFLLRLDSAGAFRFRATRIGYAEVVTSPYWIGLGDSVQVRFRLSVRAERLPPLEVLVHRRKEDPRLADYRYRKERGLSGVFIDREDQALRTASRIADALRGAAPGMRVRYEPVARSTTVTMSRGCRPAIFLDGALSSSGPLSASPLDFLSPRDIEAIEIYRGAAQVPGAFSGSASGCGVIALWTRRGGLD